MVNASWQEQTQKYWANEMCYRFASCVSENCFEKIKEGAWYPDSELRDFSNQHIYKECKEGRYVWCGSVECFDCTEGQIIDRSAYGKMNEYLTKANQSEDCERWFYVGVAQSYFLNSNNFWQQTIGEKDSCRAKTEQVVEKKASFNNTEQWSIGSCEITVSYNDFADWADEFELLVKEWTGETEKPTLEEPIIEQSPESSNQTIQNETAKGCIFQNVEYLNSFCTISKSTEKGIAKVGDPFNILLLILIAFIIYSFLFRRGR